MTWIVAIIALMGACLNARGKWQGFIFWLVSNAWWCWHNIKIGEYAQALLFVIFWLLSAYGIHQWRKKAKIESGDVNHKARFMIINFCKRILSIQKSLNRYPGRIRINWIVAEAKEILKLMSNENKTD